MRRTLRVRAVAKLTGRAEIAILSVAICFRIACGAPAATISASMAAGFLVAYFIRAYPSKADTRNIQTAGAQRDIV